MATIYTAKKLGWDKELEDYGDRGFDMLPDDDDDEDSAGDDLEGELEIIEWADKKGKTFLVGGTTADEKTIQKK